MTALTFPYLKQIVLDGTCALRRIVELCPVGGSHDKSAPPTYEGGRYALEERVVDGQPVPCVLVDSVASQANRMELALLSARRRKRMTFPLLEVDFSVFPAIQRLTTLDVPHRIADAIFRDSYLDVGGRRVSFRETSWGKSLTDASLSNATGLFEVCPTALVFGVWDSTGAQGGRGAKFPRILTSEIVGFGVVAGKRVGGRLDPLKIERSAATIYETKPELSSQVGAWTLDPAKARAEAAKGKKDAEPKKVGKGSDLGRPAQVNHGNIVPTVMDFGGGVTMEKAIQTTIISLAGLQRLEFPVAGKKPDEQEKINEAGRVVLAALALCAVELATAQGYDLRSRCYLAPAKPFRWESVGSSGGAPEALSLTPEEAISLLSEAYSEAEKLGLTWETGPMVLKPMEDLVELVKRTEALKAAGVVEEEG